MAASLSFRRECARSISLEDLLVRSESAQARGQGCAEKSSRNEGLGYTGMEKASVSRRKLVVTDAMAKAENAAQRGDVSLVPRI
jgi:hypothetical protein